MATVEEIRDRESLLELPDKYDEPGPRFYFHEGTAFINGTAYTNEGSYTNEGKAGVSQGSLFHQKAILGPDASLSTYIYAYAPGFSAETTHYHDVDQIQFITLGEEWMGNRRLRPGQGVFTPAGNAYGFRAGPQAYPVGNELVVGVAMYELRKGARFRYAKPPQPIPGWTRPKHTHKTVFFDVETAPLEPIGSVITGASSLPIEGRVQILLEPSGYDDLSLAAVTLDSEVTLPAHVQDCERSIHVLAGELTLGSDTTMQEGDGVRWPANEPLRVSAGTAGAKYIVFRACKSWTTVGEDNSLWASEDQSLMSRLGGLPF